MRARHHGPDGDSRTGRAATPTTGVPAGPGAALTIYLPATADRPAEPAPYVLTEADMVRLLRLDGNADPYQCLKRYRQKGWLRGTQVGRHIRYTLANVLRFLEILETANPR